MCLLISYIFTCTCTLSLMFLYSSIVNMFVLSYPERGSIESNKSYKSYTHTHTERERGGGGGETHS